MALKFTRKPSDYISETAYVYDVAKTSKYFDKAVYEGLSDEESRKEYLYGMAGAKDKEIIDFNENDYSYLSPEDKSSYVLWKLYGTEKETDVDETTGETFNVNDRMKAYFDQQVQAAIDKEAFDSLSGLQKTMNTVGGVVGNALNTFYGVIEGALDLVTLGVGAIYSGIAGIVPGEKTAKEAWDITKEAVSWDVTGTRAIQEALNEYTYKNTYIGKNKFATGVNDVASGISQFAVNFIPSVGPALYWMSMGGNVAGEAIAEKPDIDFASLMMYTGSVTAVEYFTEKLSGKILGNGSFIDNIIFGKSGKAATKLGEWVGKSWVTKVLGDFASEGLEESISEFADTVLWNSIVSQGDSVLRRDYSMSDILYAGLIGGTIGAVMSGGRIAFTRNLVKTEDGRIMTKQEAKASDLKIVDILTKTETINFTEDLANLSRLAETSAVSDLLTTKYNGQLTEQQLQEQHPEEYAKAVAKDEKRTKEIVEALMTLSKVYSVLGDEKFKQLSDLANMTFENAQKLAANYVESTRDKNKLSDYVNEKVKKIYGPDSSFAITKDLTPLQIRLKQNLKNAYGIDIFFGDLGQLNGVEKKFALTIDENTIILDSAQMGEMTQQEILNKVVKEELVHTLQFFKGLITPKLLLAVQEAMGSKGDVTPQQLSEAYAQDTGLTKLSEAQAKAVAEVLLFDELTVSKMFYTQYSTLSKVYRLFKNIRTKLEDSKELRSQKGKMKYNTLLKSMRMYRDVAAQNLGTETNLVQFVKDFQITALEAKQLKDAYLENPNTGSIEGFEEVAAFAVAHKGLTKEAFEILYNEDGTPKTFYKGTNVAGIKEFDSTKGEKKRQTGATWLTSSLDVANSYANERRDNATIYSVNLSRISNPKIIDAGGQLWSQAFNGKTTDQIVLDAMRENAGYDAVIITNVIDPGTYGRAAEPATDIAVLDNSKIDIIKEEPKAIETKVKMDKADGTQLELDLSTALKESAKKLEKRANRIRKISEGIQLSVFDFIDDSTPVGERETTRLKAIEQEIPYNKLKPTQAVIDKANKIKDLCSELAQSEYQGDIENHKFATLSNEIFEKGADLFGEITPDEWQAIRGVLFMDLADPRASAALNAVTRYAYLHRANQFASISDLVKTLYANSISSSGQLIGLSAHDYNNHSVQSFIMELAMKNNVEEIPLPTELILKTAPEFKSVDDFKKSLNNEIVGLKNKAKNSEDAYDKWELNRQAASKERVLTALNDNDIAVAIDEQLSNILESNENISENLQKQNATYKAIIEWLLEHAEFDKQALKGFSSKKIPLSKNLEKAKNFFEGLESFRYMMMLSNPATAAKNAISNTLILGQSYIEDFGTQFLERKNWLNNAQQVRYTGEYDQSFAKWVADNYLDKVKADAEGDKYTSSELRRLQQQYAEAKDPIKRNKLLSSIQNIERKLLNDKFWVTSRTMRNLKNTLAGSSDLIFSESRQWLVAKYRNRLQANLITDNQLIENISKTNKDLAEMYKQAASGNKVSIMKLATKLNLDIISPDLKKQNSIYYHSFYRANKMFFKIDNWFTRVMSNLNQNHPAMAYVVRHFIPFVRVTANSTSYIIDRSPIGLVKGITKAIQTKVKWQHQMISNIEQYYRQQYAKIMSQKDPEFKFNQNEFNAWLDATVDNKTKLALSGDKQALVSVFESMAKNGMVNSGAIGSDDLYTRADIMEQLSQGVTGTALISLGLLLGALTDAFEYDDDDEYLGPLINIAGIKIGIGELSPFSTLFSMSAMLTSDKVDNKIEAAFNIFADATILSTLDSALSYSDGVWDYLKNQSINIVSQYQPAITKAITKLMYNTKKDKSGDWGTKLIKTLGANSLIFNYLVPNKIDPYTGEPAKYYDTGWFEGLFDVALPIGVRVDGKSDLEKEAELYGAQTTGLSGKFTINDVNYTLTGKTKEKYAKYKAQYLNTTFEKIKSGVEKVAIKDTKTGKYKTTTYENLTADEKGRILKNLYSSATEITKIRYWLDGGNSYYTTDKNQYREYKNIFGSSAKIVYVSKWSGSKFVEG